MTITIKSAVSGGRKVRLQHPNLWCSAGLRFKGAGGRTPPAPVSSRGHAQERGTHGFPAPSALVETYYLLSDTLIASTPVVVRARLVCDSHLERQRRDVTHDVAPVHEQIPAVALVDPAVPLVSIEGPNDSAFQKKTTSLKLMNEGQRGASTQTRFQRSG